MTDPATDAGKVHCTCTPPDGVTRNHANGCALFSVHAAYRQGAAEAASAAEARAERAEAERDQAMELLRRATDAAENGTEQWADWQGRAQRAEAVVAAARACVEHWYGTYEFDPLTAAVDKMDKNIMALSAALDRLAPDRFCITTPDGGCVSTGLHAESSDERTA